MSTKEGHAYKRYHSRKHHAKKNNIPFTITLEYVVSLICDECPILGIPLSWTVRSEKVTHNSPSLDRIIPELGYVKGNVRVISARANLLKNDATILELELVLQDLKRLHES